MEICSAIRNGGGRVGNELVTTECIDSTVGTVLDSMDTRVLMILCEIEDKG